MNIFISNPNPIKSAIALDDRRLIKMILETAQLLSGALHELGIADGLDIYKVTHKNHPCAIWARESVGNFSWLLRHFEALSLEYKRRFSKDHKTYVALMEIFSGPALERLGQRLVNKKLTAFVNCTEFKEQKNIYHAYRQALRKKWQNNGPAAR